MDFIKSVVPLTDSTKLKGFLGESDQLHQFHELIRTQKVRSDDDAYNMLYGKQGSIYAYRKLKQRLRDRLTEYIVQHGVAYKNLDDYARLYRKCMSKVMAVKTLISCNARHAAMEIGEELIKTTIRNEYTELTLLLSKDLFTHYSVINFNKTKLEKYEQVMNSAHELYLREFEINKCYCSLRAAFSTTRASIKAKYLSRAEEYAATAQMYIDSTNVSYQLLLLSYLVIVMRYELSKNYSKLIKICNEATKAFSSRRVSRPFILYQFDLYKIASHIQLGNNVEAERIANERLKHVTKGHLNWFVILIYIILSKLHSKRFTEAYGLLQEAINERSYKRLPDTHLQIYIVYEAYIEFLSAIGLVQSESNTKFRLYKFLNEIPIYTKDKRGLNISILIVHILFLLHQKRYNQIIDRVDALNQYCHRHLRRDDTFRSNCFVKALLQMAKANFNRKRTERYAQQYIQKLRLMPISASDQSIEVEIIPYEELWSIVLDLLN